MAVKKKAVKRKAAPIKRKRKVSAKTLAALARGRAKRKSNLKAAKKKTSKKTVSKPVQQERKTMAKKKKATSEKPRKRSRAKGYARGIAGKAKGMIPMVKDVAIAVAGGVGGGVLANKLPIANPKVKAAIPLVAGLAIASILGKKKHIFHEIGTGMAVIGGIALLKQFAPNVPMLAGEDEVVLLPPGYEGCGGDMLQLGYDDDADLMGDMLQLGDESEEYMSPANM